MHYTITNINMNTRTNTNNHLHVGINMCISTDTNTYLHILVYISIHTAIINKQKIMNTSKHPCANIFVFYIPIYQHTNISLYYRMNDYECANMPICQYTNKRVL